MAEAYANEHKETTSITISEHDCRDFSVLSSDSAEYVCIRCGAIDQETTAREADIAMYADRARALATNTHHAGDGLLDSETVQADWVSFQNKGVACSLNDPSGRDFAGHKIKKQLQDPYWSGIIAGKDCHIEEDILTGQNKICVSRYDVPMLRLFKQRTEQLATDYHLDTVDKTKVAQQVKKIASRLVMSGLSEYVAVAAILNADVIRNVKDVEALESALLIHLDELRLHLISRCQSDALKAIKIQEKEQAQAANPAQQRRKKLPPIKAKH